jgi:hypothetical protein
VLLLDIAYGTLEEMTRILRILVEMVSLYWLIRFWIVIKLMGKELEDVE